ncbi:DNA-binding protein SMUBP-2-like, partial [Hyalella azteca]|uniref:DNA-binding protein SMUBP-2-like n=1 Tax=Hyalella azteca TaxID=294128 RepID=A0A979FJF5_HYAAZ
YRMHVDIMSWSSAALYNNQLIAHESVSQYLLKDLPYVSNNEYTGVPLLLVDTSSCPGFEESITASRSNEGEASMVLALVQKMISAGLSQQQVAVISPYSQQVKLVRSLVQVDYPEVEVQTVDGFQGRKKEAVILTLVRSNTKGEIGFLAEDRRLNVAATRARRHLSANVQCGKCEVQENGLNGYNTDLHKWKSIIAQQKPAPASEKIIITEVSKLFSSEDDDADEESGPRAASEPSLDCPAAALGPLASSKVMSMDDDDEFSEGFVTEMSSDEEDSS